MKTRDRRKVVGIDVSKTTLMVSSRRRQEGESAAVSGHGRGRSGGAGRGAGTR